MIDKRYQVFISTSGSDMQPERIVLTQTLVSMGFFSWGLEQRTPLSTAFSRRQIDDCDFVVLLLGSQYGEQSVSGVSYMQLEYIYAVSKQKPIIVFMHEDPESRAAHLQESKPELKTKFKDFRHQLQHEVDQVVSFRTLRDLELAIRFNMPQMLERYSVTGWIRPNNTQALHDEIDRLKNHVAKLEALLGYHKDDADLTVPKVSMHEFLTFEYRMHAYQDGNFKEVSVERKMSWAQLLAVLGAGFKTAAPEQNFSRQLNDYLNATALTDARRFLPRAHAVARCQINIQALHNIKVQMQQNDWIVPLRRDERQRMLWQLTPKGQKLLESNLLDSDRVLQFSLPH